MINWTTRYLSFFRSWLLFNIFFLILIYEVCSIINFLQILPEQEWIRSSGRSAERIQHTDKRRNEEVEVHDDYERSHWSILVGLRGQVHTVSCSRCSIILGLCEKWRRKKVHNITRAVLSRIPHGAGYCNGCHRNMTCFILSEYDRIQTQLARGHLFRSFEDRHFFPQNWWVKGNHSLYHWNEIKSVTEKIVSGAATSSRSTITIAFSVTLVTLPTLFSGISFPFWRSNECPRPLSNSFGIN